MQSLIPRDDLETILRWMPQREIVVLLGARQVGKTSLIKLIWQKLPESKTFFFDLEKSDDLNRFRSIESFLSYLQARGFDGKHQIYVAIDEAQYLPKPSNFLKVIHDHHPLIKLIVSGSSALDIRKQFKDALTGRKVVFEIHPLNFSEYLYFTHHKEAGIKQKVHIDSVLENFGAVKPYGSLTGTIAPAFEIFAVWGGYPLVSLSKTKEEKLRRLKEIHDTYLQKDVRDLAKVENLAGFNRLVSFLAVQSSQLLNLQNLSRELQMPRRDVERFIAILEKTFVVERTLPFHSNRQKELVKMSKLFFADTGLRNMNIEDMRPLELRQDKGYLIENAVFAELKKRKELTARIQFWRTKDGSEVDFIRVLNREPLPIEVKYQTFTRPSLEPSLKNFISKYEPRQAVVVTRDFLCQSQVGRTKVFHIPAWMV